MDADLHISLSPSAKEWLDRQVTARGFRNPSEVVEDILRREQDLEYRAAIDEKLKQSIASSPSTPMNAAEWKRLRDSGRELAARRSGQ